MENSSRPGRFMVPQRAIVIGILLVLVLFGAWLLRADKDFAPALSETKPALYDADSDATLITALPDSAVPRIDTNNNFRANVGTRQKATTITATRDNSSRTTDSLTSEPLKQEAYLAAMTELMEEEGKDNALFHYALAFELAPPLPTPEQAELIKMVLDEGWDERAEELLPYLLAWQAAFEKLHYGASLDYARGIGFDEGANTPVPNFLLAQNASKMLAVYSRYLESEGRGGEAATQLNTALTMGRDFNSPGNLMISNMIGTAIGSVGLRQLSHLVSSNALSGAELDMVKSRLRVIEQGQQTAQGQIDAEFETIATAIRKLRDDPTAYDSQTDSHPAAGYLRDGSVISLEIYEEEHRKLWAELSEYFSVPYWERKSKTVPEPDIAIARPNFAESEARFLSVTSRLRQQQIDIAVRQYMADNQNAPPTINTLVQRNYLLEAPVDPFTGQPFSYIPTSSSYELYGSGPNIEATVDPNTTWNPVNGTFSPGIIRTR